MTQAKPRTITATYRIVTPMFCAGADQNSAELRLPSFKGALRFWWRSLMWGTVADHNELREKEAELFGASDSKTGQAKVCIRITHRNVAGAVNPPAVFEGGRLLGAHYLGYGVMEAFPSKKKGTKAGQLTRAMIPEGTMTVECLISPLASHQQIDEIRRALLLLGTVGGLGSKSRKGYGSLTITDQTLDGERTELNIDPSLRLRSTLSQPTESLPAWTAWHSGVRVVVAGATKAKRAVELLDLIGREQVHFRSWGRDGKILREESERNFPLDHDLNEGRSVPIDYPFRVAFGLPHNYGKGPQNSVEPSKHDRRASPLVIHIDQTTDRDQPKAVLAFLPSQFLPNGERLNAFGQETAIHFDESFWFPVHAFLDRLVVNGKEPKPRPGYDNFPKDSTWWQKKTSIVAQEVNLD